MATLLELNSTFRRLTCRATSVLNLKLATKVTRPPAFSHRKDSSKGLLLHSTNVAIPTTITRVCANALTCIISCYKGHLRRSCGIPVRPTSNVYHSFSTDEQCENALLIHDTINVRPRGTYLIV
jgi:hypothetical protein